MTKIEAIAEAEYELRDAVNHRGITIRRYCAVNIEALKVLIEIAKGSGKAEAKTIDMVRTKLFTWVDSGSPIWEMLADMIETAKASGSTLVPSSHNEAPEEIQAFNDRIGYFSIKDETPDPDTQICYCGHSRASHKKKKDGPYGYCEACDDNEEYGHYCNRFAWTKKYEKDF